jgi:pSer/pThr/pTyr-binding forkhead associated (FHA) protein
MRTYLVGRSPYADIVIADPSVAEHHAEIVVAEDGRLFITDCGTGAGTWQLTSEAGRSAWMPIRQAFIERGDVLRLGAHECRVSEVLSPVEPELQVAPIGPVRPDAARLGGRLRRDPTTGEIVRRRL